MRLFYSTTINHSDPFQLRAEQKWQSLAQYYIDNFQTLPESYADNFRQLFKYKQEDSECKFFKLANELESRLKAHYDNQHKYTHST